VEVDPELAERDIMTAHLVLKTKDRVYSKRIDRVKGNPLNPMSLDDCIEKFRKCVLSYQRPMPGEKVEEILDCLVNLEGLKDIRTLMGLLS